MANFHLINWEMLRAISRQHEQVRTRCERLINTEMLGLILRQHEQARALCQTRYSPIKTILDGYLTRLGTLPATLPVPESISNPERPPLDSIEFDPGNCTDEDLRKRPRRIGFNRDDEESEKE